MKNWKHSGFHVFVGQPVAADDTDARLFLGRYLKRSPVALSRLELVESDSGHLIRINKITDDGTQSRELEPLEFLAELQAQLPDLWEQTSRYFGCYSARARGAKRLSLDTPGPLPDNDLPAKPTPEWAGV